MQHQHIYTDMRERITVLVDKGWMKTFLEKYLIISIFLGKSRKTHQSVLGLDGKQNLRVWDWIVTNKASIIQVKPAFARYSQEKLGAHTAGQHPATIASSATLWEAAPSVLTVSPLPPLSQATLAENTALLSCSVFQINAYYPASIPPIICSGNPISTAMHQTLLPERNWSQTPNLTPTYGEEASPIESVLDNPGGVPTGDVDNRADLGSLGTLTVDIAWWGPGPWCLVEDLECTGSFYSTVLRCCCCLCWGWEEPWGGELVHRTAGKKEKECYWTNRSQYLSIDQRHYRRQCTLLTLFSIHRYYSVIMGHC